MRRAREGSERRCGLAQVVVAPYPYCLHCPVRAAHPEGASWYKVGWGLICSITLD